MESAYRRQDAIKSMAFDLWNIVDENPTKETYTKDELKEMIKKLVQENTEPKNR